MYNTNIYFGLGQDGFQVEFDKYSYPTHYLSGPKNSYTFK